LHPASTLKSLEVIQVVERGSTNRFLMAVGSLGLRGGRGRSREVADDSEMKLDYLT
jgi:hypothetical protein